MPQTSVEIVPVTPPTIVIKPVTSSIGGFKGNSTALTQSMKSSLKKLYAANSKFDTVVVSGFTTGSTKIKANAAIAKVRAAKVAAYLKSIGFKGKLSSVTGKQTSSSATRSGSVQIRFSNQPVK